MADRLDLPSRHRRTLESLIGEYLPGVEAWAYGSRVNGRSHDGSDLDLVLRGPGLEKIQSERLADFADAVRESSIPFLVETRDWARVPDRFRQEIGREHVVLSSPPTRSGSWQKARLGDVARLRRGHDLPKRLRVAGSFPIVSSSGITDCHAESKARGPGVVIGRYGTLGKVHFVRGDYWPLNTTLYVENFKGNEPRYVSYLLETIDVHPFSDKAAVPGLNRNHLHKAEVPFTSDPAEQRAIAHILGTLDDKIEINRRMNETLEAMARALFKSWFVDFEPVRAKMEGRDTGLPAHIADLFPDTLDDEHKPHGWSLCTLAALAHVNPESWSSRNVPDHVEYVELANTKWGTIETTQRFLWQEAPSRARRVLRPGDAIVGTVRPGNGSFAFIAATGLTGSTGFAVIRPRKRRDAAFVFLSATAPENIERLAHLADGAAYPAVRPQVVGATQAAVPNDGLMERFAAVASPVLDQIESNKVENHTLAQIRDLLLPKLISGEIRVQQAEKTVAEIL